MKRVGRREFLAATAAAAVSLNSCRESTPENASTQTWWGNIDLNHDQTVMYPKTPVTPGGITDRFLSDYPNMYGDLSANSGLNSMLRDEEHARQFLDRHQDKLVWASDCSDTFGEGDQCIGSKGLPTVRRLAPNQEAIRKILYGNAARLLQIT